MDLMRWCLLGTTGFAVRSVEGDVGVFPQYLADRFGWDTMTATVARVYSSLPAPERSEACVFTDNYGEASALTFLGKSYGPPTVISGHNNFYVWGPGSCSGQVLITVGLSYADLSRSYGDITLAGTNICRYCVSGEDNLSIYVATHPLSSTGLLWSTAKHFD